MSNKGIFGTISNTAALRRELLERAASGDLAALDLLSAAVPPEMPPEMVRQFRDNELLGLAQWLRPLLGEASSVRRVSETIAAVWKMADRPEGDPARRPLVPELEVAERAELGARVARLARLCGEAPSATRIRAVLARQF